MPTNTTFDNCTACCTQPNVWWCVCFNVTGPGSPNGQWCCLVEAPSTTPPGAWGSRNQNNGGGSWTIILTLNGVDVSPQCGYPYTLAEPAAAFQSATQTTQGAQCPPAAGQVCVTYHTTCTGACGGCVTESQTLTGATTDTWTCQLDDPSVTGGSYYNLHIKRNGTIVYTTPISCTTGVVSCTIDSVVNGACGSSSTCCPGLENRSLQILLTNGDGYCPALNGQVISMTYNGGYSWSGQYLGSTQISFTLTCLNANQGCNGLQLAVTTDCPGWPAQNLTPSTNPCNCSGSTGTVVFNPFNMPEACLCPGSIAGGQITPSLSWT